MHIVVLGDSIAQGLGVEGCSYADRLQRRMSAACGQEVKLSNLAYTAWQISDSMERLPATIEAQPDLVIIAHGISEAIVRPVPGALRFVPPRWRNKGWMDPRPYFSRRPLKRLIQQAESALRWRVKVALIKKIGGMTWTSAQEFESGLRIFVEEVLCHTPAHILLLTHSGIDERFFPGSASSLAAYKECLNHLAAEERYAGRVHVCDVSEALHRWSDFFADHFHPNEHGHALIEEALYQRVMQVRDLSDKYNESGIHS